VILWLVTDQLGTPRMIFDQTGSLATTKRHDYLPFGEELFAGTGGRTTTMGYTPPGNSAADGVRQQFTDKERDTETGLDYFGARYYASVQGRFTGADPYDINFERQESADQEEADALFTKYIGQPQHWNRYAYALNNPLRNVDPDGRKDEEYEVVLLGKTIKVKISDKLDKDTRAAIKENINAAISRINEAKDLTTEQIKQVNKLNGLKIGPDIGSTAMNKASGYFEMKPDWVLKTPSVDFLAAGILHDNAHQGQSDPEPDTDKFINNEKKASAFAAGIARKISLESAAIKWLDDDALTGHLLNGKLPSSRPPKKKKQ
jgi:RHS repeat-associated protein